jgi:hypothetical protein
MQHLFKILTYCFFSIILFFSCDTNKNKIDVSKVKHSFKSIRFDKELFASDTTNFPQSITSLINKYPLFADIYFKEITGFAKTNDSTMFYNSVKHFITYKDYKGLQDSVNVKFADTKKLDATLLDLFKHIKYYFPETKLGTVYYFTSGLNNWSAITIDSSIGIGLDMYLGSQYPFYSSVQLPGYQIARCEPSYIPINVCKNIYEADHPMDAESKTLLDLMTMRGKQMVYVESMLPDVEKHKLFGYTPEQYQWCEDNEAAIWNYFTKQKLIYSTLWQDILRYVNDGPSSTGMPPECPGNIGTFIGWKIMKNYASQKSEFKLQELINSKMESQALLQMSKYKPK